LLVFPRCTLGSNLIHLRPAPSANDILYNLLKLEEDETTSKSSVILEGLVSKRRAIGKHLVFLGVVPMDLPDIKTHDSKRQKTKHDDIESIAPVQAILRREIWEKLDEDDNNSDNTTTCSYDVYHKIIQPGVHVKLTGNAGPSRLASEAILFCQDAKYTLANNNPQHLRNVLRYAREEALNISEVLDALPCIEHDELVHMIGLGDKPIQNNHGCFGELAADILSRFPRNYLCNPSQLMGSTNAQKVKLLPPAPPEYIDAPSFLRDKGANYADEEEVVSIASLLQRQTQMCNEHMRVSLAGWVQNRRRYQGTITVLELVEEFSSLASLTFGAGDDKEGESDENVNMKARSSKLKELWKDRIYAVLHPDALQAGFNSGEDLDISNSTVLSEMYGNILCSGARVVLQGYLSANSSSENTLTFWVKSCRLLRSSWRPSAVRLVLDLLHEGKFAVDEAADALELEGGYSQAEDIAMGSTSATDRQWLATEQVLLLQGENSRVGKLTSAMYTALDEFSYARDKYPVERIKPDVGFDDDVDTEQVEIGSTLRKSPEGSRWQRAKKPQLEFMIDQIERVLRSHPEYGLRKLKVIDIGGGKGLLSNALAEKVGSEIVEVQVVDISTSATNNGMMRAKRLGLQNVQYTALDATTLDVTGVDVVVALHACGVLSDVALGHATCQGAGFVVCPCCFRSNPHLRVSMPSDMSGQTKLVTPEEWLNVDPTQYDALKQLAELQGDIKLAGEGMHSVCGLRAMAVESLWHNPEIPKSNIDISIKTFPIGFSTRNICLVGTFHNNKE